MCHVWIGLGGSLRHPSYGVSNGWMTLELGS